MKKNIIVIILSDFLPELIISFRSKAQKLAKGRLDYTVIIKGIDIEVKQKGKDWLNTIANGVRNIINSEIAMAG